MSVYQSQEVSLMVEAVATVTIKRIRQALGKDISVIRRRANKENWAFEEVRGNGGKQRHYATSELPEDVRFALNSLAATEAAQAVFDSRPVNKPEIRKDIKQSGQEAKAKAETKKQARRANKEALLVAYAALSPDSPKRRRADAHFTILQAMWDHRKTLPGVADRKADVIFAEKANAGDIELPADVWAYVPRHNGKRLLSEPSLRRWHYKYQSGGIGALIDQHGKSKGRSKVYEHPELVEALIAIMLEFPHHGGKAARSYLQASPKYRHLATLVSDRTVHRFMTDWKRENEQFYTKETNPDAWKNKFMAAVGSHHERIERLNQVWELDSTPGDVMLKDGRHCVIGVIDLYSRRMKFLVSKTSKASAVCQLFRRTLQEWGVPEIIRTDNGSDYVSNQFVSVVKSLEIEQELCMPFASEQKGTIERGLQTMSHGIVEMLPGYIGHSVADRKVIEARKSFAQRIMSKDDIVDVSLTSSELQKLLDDWAEYAYGRDPHSGLDGRSPFEVATSWKIPPLKIIDDRALDALLAEIAGTRTITKKGIRFNSHYYDAPELFVHVGKEATLKYDEADIGRLTVYVDGAFVAIAECAELLGISRKERAQRAHQAQSEFLKSQKAEYSKFRKQVDKNIGQVVLDHRKREAENVTMLPHTGLEYTTEGLAQADIAARTARSRQPDPAPADIKAATDEFKAQFEAEHRAPVTRLESPREKYERWVRIDRQLAAGEAVSENDTKFHRLYSHSDEFRSMRALYEDFNLEVKGLEA